MGAGASADKKYKTEYEALAKRGEALESQVESLNKTVATLKGELQEGRIATTVDELSSMLLGGEWACGKLFGDTKASSLAFGKRFCVSVDEENKDGRWILQHIGIKFYLIMCWADGQEGSYELDQFEAKGTIRFKSMSDLGCIFNYPGKPALTHWKLNPVELKGPLEAKDSRHDKPTQCVLVKTDADSGKELIPGSLYGTRTSIARHGHEEGHFNRGKLVPGTFMPFGEEPKAADAIGLQTDESDGQIGPLFVGCAHHEAGICVFGKVCKGVCYYAFDGERRATQIFQYITVDVNQLRATKFRKMDKVPLSYTTVPDDFALPIKGQRFALRPQCDEEKCFELYGHEGGNRMCWSGCCSDECAFWHVDHVDAEGAFQLRMNHHDGIAVNVDSIQDGAQVGTTHGKGTVFICKKNNDFVRICTKENPSLFITCSKEHPDLYEVLLATEDEEHQNIRICPNEEDQCAALHYESAPSGFPLPTNDEGAPEFFILRPKFDQRSCFELFCHEGGNNICWSHCCSEECAHWYADYIGEDGAFQIRMPHHGNIAVAVDAKEEGSMVKTCHGEEATMWICTPVGDEVRISPKGHPELFVTFGDHFEHGTHKVCLTKKQDVSSLIVVCEL